MKEKNKSNLKTTQQIETAVVKEFEDFEYFGVKFPHYFKNPHFIQLPDGAIILGVDPACVTMEMKAKWREVYVPELMKLTKQVLEKLTGETIGSR